MTGRPPTPNEALDRLRVEWLITAAEPESSERATVLRGIEAAARAVKIVRDTPTPRKPTTEPQEGTA